jgi:HEAT repeat protein
MFRKKSQEEEELSKYFPSLKSKDMGESLSAVSKIVSMASASPETIGRYLVSLLPKMLKDGDVRIRTRAALMASGLISALPGFRGDLVESVVGLLGHSDPAMRMYASALLGRISTDYPEHVMNHLEEVLTLLGEKDPLKVWTTSNALGEIGFRSPGLAGDVVAKMAEPLREKGAFFITALSRISLGSPLAVESAIPQMVEAVRKASDLFVGLEVSVIMARLAYASPELAEVSVLPHVRSLIEDKNFVARASSVYLVGELGIRRPGLVKELAPRLTALFGDKDAYVRLLLALAMSRVSYRSREFAETFAPLLTRLLEDREDHVRGAAAIGLRYLAASAPDLVEPIVPKLSGMLEEKNRTLRGIAGLSLQLVSKVAPDIISEIIERAGKAVAEGGADARRGAVVTLHMVSRYPDTEIDEGLLPEIERLMGDNDVKVRGRSVMALKNMTPTFPDFVLEQLPRVIDLLGDKEREVKIQAAYALGEVSDYHPETVKKLALERLVKALEDPDQMVRAIAALSLGRIF